MTFPNFSNLTPQPPGGKRDSNGPANKRPALLGAIAAAVAILLMVVPILVGIYTDFLWFAATQFQEVYWNVVIMRALLFVAFGLFAGLIVWAALFAAYRSAPDEFQLMSAQFGDQPLALSRTKMRPFLVMLPAIVALIAGLQGQAAWRTMMLFANGTEFGVSDPQFGKDLSFYAFQLPLLNLIVAALSVLLMVAFVANGVFHYLMGNITTGNPRTGEKAQVRTPARRQLAIIAGLWMLVRAGDYWLRRYGLMNRGTADSTFTGAGYTDINAVLPAQIVLLVISIFVAVMFFGTIVLRDLRLPALAVALMIGSSLVVGTAWPTILEQFSVKPNRAEKEREYIARNIEATRFAYNLGDDQVTYERNWGVAPEEADVQVQEAENQKVENDTATLSNIRLLDPQILSPTFTQQQQLKNFYGFPDELAVDRYEVDGQLRDFVVAARELNPNSLDGNQQDWINRHTVYTHGNGFIAAPANKIDEVARDAGSARGGYPVYTVADLQSLEKGEQGGELQVDLEQPRIYFGPVIASSRIPNSDYAIVGNQGAASPQEYDTDANNYTYSGEGGVDVDNYFNRLMFAAKFQSMNLLLTDRIGEGSKILHQRDPRERVHKVAPWLTTDSKTYPVVLDGRIKWIVDGYTTLRDLPYAQRTSLRDTTADATTPQGVNQSQIVTDQVSYIRNSVKAVVDAYDGSVNLYAFDEQDPVLQAWMGAFPGVVQPKSAISEELNVHLRYPSDIFKVQRELIAKYHVSDPGVFFQNDAFWSVPTDPTANQGAEDLPQPPYYVVAADPKTGRPSFQVITPFRGLSRQFLAAHMSVSSDPDTYGQIYVRVLPTNTQTQGPAQAQDTMMSSDEVARERTLLQGTNEVINGNLLTLPVGGGKILYVEPVYAKRKEQESAFPKMLRVLVSYDNQVGYAPTIAEALQQVGLDSSAVQDLREVDGSVVAGGGAEGSTVESDAASDAADAAGAESGAAGGSAAAGAAANSADAAQAVRDAMNKVNRARSSGTFEEFGKALDELDAAVARLQQG